MPLFKKETEELIITWLFATVGSGIPCMVVFSVIIRAVYGCWPDAQPGNTCLACIEPQYIIWLPLVIAAIIGTIITYKITKTDSNEEG